MKATVMKIHNDKFDTFEFDEFKDDDFAVEGLAYDDDDDFDDDDDDDDDFDEEEVNSPYNRIEGEGLTKPGRDRLLGRMGRLRKRMNKSEKARFDWEDYDL